MKCGSAIHESDTFCPSCGVSVSESAFQGGNNNAPVEKPKDYLKIVSILSGIWGVIALLMGILFLATSGILADMVRENPEIFEGIIDISDLNQLENVLKMIGVIYMISGVLSLVTSFLSAKKKMFFITLLSCIAASIILIVFGEYLGIVGLIIVVLIYLSRFAFEDFPKKTI